MDKKALIDILKRYKAENIDRYAISILKNKTKNDQY